MDLTDVEKKLKDMDCEISNLIFATNSITNVIGEHTKHNNIAAKIIKLHTDTLSRHSEILKTLATTQKSIIDAFSQLGIQVVPVPAQDEKKEDNNKRYIS